MKGISYMVANELGSQGIIQREDVDKCKYGLEVMLSSLLEILSILLFSVFVGNFFETVLLFVAFIPLRIYAGGYHANTKLKCYFISVAVYLVFTIIIYTLPQELYWLINMICTIFSSIIVFAVAPIVHSNKLINAIEKKYYRKFSTIIVVTETAIILVLSIFFPIRIIGISLALGQVFVSLSMVAAIVKKRLCNK